MSEVTCKYCKKVNNSSFSSYFGILIPTKTNFTYFFLLLSVYLNSDRAKRNASKPNPNSVSIASQLAPSAIK